MVAAQFGFVGCYQLSRLWFCFSNEQVHGRNGYPRWVFVFMVAVFIVVFVSWIVFFLMAKPLPSSCGYQRGFTFFWEDHDRSVMQILMEGRWVLIGYIVLMAMTAAVQIWDLSTLLLYVWKIHKIGKIYKTKNDAVWSNVLHILHRIVIITIFYEICIFTMAVSFIGLWAVFPKYLHSQIYTLNGLLNCVLPNIIWSLSMYLMMDHNTASYVRFISILRRLHLDYLCFCCCHSMVSSQLDALDSAEPPTVKNEPDLCERKTPYTEFENVSVDMSYSIKMNRVVSPETMTTVRAQV